VPVAAPLSPPQAVQTSLAQMGVLPVQAALSVAMHCTHLLVDGSHTPASLQSRSPAQS
jgi:hypothetical protein